MPRPSHRTSKKRFYRAVGGDTRIKYLNNKPGKHHCANCGGGLHGVPHSKGVVGTRKLSRSARRPSALFAGKLCGKCRTSAVSEAAMVKSGFKKIEDVTLSMKAFVMEAMECVE